MSIVCGIQCNIRNNREVFDKINTKRTEKLYKVVLGLIYIFLINKNCIKNANYEY
jgi:hypothetical protein